jgi:tRNA(fMet)-specific endonuclease VapC
MALKSEHKDSNLAIVEAFLKNINVYPIDKVTARIYGGFSVDIFNKFAPKDHKKRRKFKIKNAGIGISDLLIACTAIQYKLTIVSEDKDFRLLSQVRPLSIESWKS